MPFIEGRRAIISAPLAPMHSEPKVSSPQISQRLSGHSARVLEVREDWLHVRGEDDYDGWVHRGYVAKGATREDAERSAGIAGKRIMSLGCTAVGFDGHRRHLPLGAWLLAGERSIQGQVLREQSMRSSLPMDAEAAAASAVDWYEGASYQWGGVTPWGADCSGMVQTVFWMHGLVLPRDASQQALVGADAGNDIAALKAGDLLFFSDRPDKRITHVGISLGHCDMVHCALGRGGYAIEALGEDKDGYTTALRERFLFARRPEFAAS